MNLEVRIQKSRGQYLASCDKLNIHSFGETKSKAVVRLKLILKFYMETVKELGHEIDENEISPANINSSNNSEINFSTTSLINQEEKFIN